jgi:hypothetical protein
MDGVIQSVQYPRLMFASLGVKSYVYLPDLFGEHLATWNNDANEWAVTASNNVGLYYRRDELSGAVKYLAKTANKEGVRWEHNVLLDESMWVQLDSNGQILYPEIGRVWRWTNGGWILTDFDQ